jgi:hypothetical protein
MRPFACDVVSWNEAVREPLFRATLPDPSKAKGAEIPDVVTIAVVVVVVVVVLVAACTASTKPNQLFPCPLLHVTA